MKTRLRIAICLLALMLAGCQAPQQTPAAPPPTQAQPIGPSAALSSTATPAVPATPSAAPTPAAMAELIAAARQEGELNVIALPADWMNFGAIIKAFYERYNIVVNQLDPNAGSAQELQAIQNTRTANRQSAPDVIDVGLPFAAQAKAAGLLAPYKVATWDTIPANAKDPEANWYGDYYGLIAFEVNPKYVPSLPQDWPDLLNPGFKIAKPISPVNSYQGMMAVYSAAVANGGSLENALPGLRFFQQLNQKGSLINLQGEPSGDTVAAGETPVVINWDFLALGDAQSHPGADIRVIVPKSGNIAGLYAQWISAYAPHPSAAKLWMEFLYSDEGQLLLLQGLGHPVRFADLSARHLIPADLLTQLPPADPYLSAQFPTAEQISTADKWILENWNKYLP